MCKLTFCCKVLIFNIKVSVFTKAGNKLVTKRHTICIFFTLTFMLQKYYFLGYHKQKKSIANALLLHWLLIPAFNSIFCIAPAVKHTFFYNIGFIVCRPLYLICTFNFWQYVWQ